MFSIIYWYKLDGGIRAEVTLEDNKIWEDDFHSNVTHDQVMSRFCLRLAEVLKNA